MVRWLTGVAAVFMLAVIAAGIWLWHPLPANPPAGELAAPAAGYDVEIIRDEWGVPHVFGARDADVAFGLAYAHAEDDFETIQEVVAATRGVLASYRGADAAPTDYLVSLLGVWRTVDARYDSDVPPEVRALAEGYAHGLNLYAAQNPEATWRGLAPFTGEDVVAGFVFKTPLFYGLDETLLELFGDDRQAELALDPSAGREAFIIGPKGPAERGSNAFAVAPERSGDGVTRLVINSHQPMTGPVAWYEAHLHSDEGLDITGGVFPGTPVILHGFNRHLGWANTVSKPDLVDVYRLVPAGDGDAGYLLDGEVRSFETETAVIDVRLFGPFAYRARREVRRSVHGPVIEAPHGTYAIRFAGMGEIGQLAQYHALGRARSLAEFLDAMRMNALPSINYVYADKDGNIAFIHNGQYPDRAPGWDWQKDLPGDRSDLIWQGYRPFEAIPKLINPQSGFLYNANNQPFSATDGPDNLKPSAFPPEMGLQTNETNRALRIMELTAGTAAIPRERLMEIKFDTAYAEGSDADRVVREVLAMDWSGEPAMAEAAAHLSAWDYRLDADSRHAPLGGLTVLREITQEFTGIPAPSPEQAFREAVEWLETHHGRIDPAWGEVNRLVRGETDLPLSGGADTLRAVYPAAMDESGRLEAAAGDTWIAIVEWDRDASVRADVIHQFGSATRDKSSPHFDDQAPLFAAGEWRRAVFDESRLRAEASRIYRPQAQ